MKYTHLFVFLLPFLLGSCAALNRDADIPVLDGIKWTLTAIEGKSHNYGDKTVIEFDTKEYTISGKAGCNGFSAEYEAFTDNRITLQEITSTKMYCEGMMAVESQMLTNLAKVKRYEIKADKLYLYGETHVLLTFKR